MLTPAHSCIDQSFLFTSLLLLYSFRSARHLAPGPPTSSPRTSVSSCNASLSDQWANTRDQTRKSCDLKQHNEQAEQVVHDTRDLKNTSVRQQADWLPFL
ncbi:hypothetical protein K432DRAFT_382773 [Lepidopterella palustris CBS 459.81]|uniref:Secreted protein n=1 Tax=Lepidopterella palustris CBS 459.81 TaxID=1314670 RepID=A0A8E2E992_9PEZI|nr:hypothetical protein K432DRAFT_382773 [Lepidopterella palustris CBS 459.81]